MYDNIDLLLIFLWWVFIGISIMWYSNTITSQNTMQSYCEYTYTWSLYDENYKTCIINNTMNPILFLK